MRATASVCLGVLSLFAALATGGAAPLATCQACTPCQSPRDVKPARTTHPHTQSIVERVSPDQKQVWIRGRQAPLVFCGQHYHAPVENVQGCGNEDALISAPPPAGSGMAPDPEQWIEVHTVYAPGVKPNCQAWQTLDCCDGVTAQDPALVRAFSARVAASRRGAPTPGPILIPTPDRGPLAEWSGSNTGPDSPGTPGECKPTPALWSFRLTTCASPFTVTQAALDESFGCLQKAGAKSGTCGWQGARELQGGPRASDDLRHIP